MPTLTMLLIDWPVKPFHSPLRTRSQNAAILSEHRVDAGDHVLAVNHDLFAFRRTQGDVQDGAVLGRVDLVAGEHRLAASGEVGLLGELQEELGAFRR